MFMFLFLAKRIPKSHRHLHPLLRRLFSYASTTQNPDPKAPKFSVVDYLVASFGFSPDKATRASKRISHLKSPEKPDSVRSFLKEQGFSEADIKKLIIGRPDLLSSSPQKTLDPNLRALRDMGLSTSALNKIILSNPTALDCRSAVPRITFWNDFLGGDEAALVKAFTRYGALVNYDICQDFAPKISLLQSHGFSNLEIRRMMCTVPRLITNRISGMEDLLNRVKELGFQPGSGMFLRGLQAMVAVPRDVFKKRMDLLMSFGWSEDDFFSAVRTDPLMVALKEENLRTKMEFLLGEARCAPSYIKSHPYLLGFSLEKRLRPRNNVMHLLKIRGLSDQGLSFMHPFRLTNNQFVERYITPYKEEISGLYEIYLASCA